MLSDQVQEKINRELKKYPADQKQSAVMSALRFVQEEKGWISSDDMKTFLLGVDWKTVVGGLGQRWMEPIEQKRQGVTYSNSLDLGIVDGHVVRPAGLVNTSGIENLLRPAADRRHICQ